MEDKDEMVPYVRACACVRVTEYTVSTGTGTE